MSWMRNAIAALAVFAFFNLASSVNAASANVAPDDENVAQNQENSEKAAGGGANAAASGGGEPEKQEPDYGKEVEEGLSSGGANILGDSINTEDGSLTFSVTDVSLPGNSSLPVEFSRSYAIDGLDYFDNLYGGWNVGVPFITGRYTEGSYGVHARCTQSFAPYAPSAHPQAKESTGWGGMRMFIPGEGGQLLLEGVAGSSVIWGVVPKKTTTGHWKFECLTSVDNGPGEGFIATSPSGVKYYFDYIAEFFSGIMSGGDEPTSGCGSLTAPGGKFANFCDPGEPVNAAWVHLLASRVEDPSGAWVEYEYDTEGKVTRIHSNDGREITIAYAINTTSSGGAPTLRLASVTANGRTWTYSYEDVAPNWSKRKLNTVTLPDGRFWDYDLLYTSQKSPSTYHCLSGGDQVLLQGTGASVQVKHPDGVVGVFDFDLIDNGLNNVTTTKHPDITNYHNPLRCDEYAVPAVRVTKAVIAKTLTIPNASSAAWTYWYQQDKGHRNYPSGPASLDLKKRTITDPNGDTSDLYYNRRHGSHLEGQLIRTERFNNGAGAALEVTVNDYEQGPVLGDSRVFSRGVPPRNYSTPLKSRTITRGADTYTTQYTYNLNLASSAYSFNKPTRIERSSTIQTGSRITDYTYEHNKTLWAIGLAKTVTNNGKLFDEYIYDTLGRVLEHKKFGSTWRTYIYKTYPGEEGFIDTIYDAQGRSTWFGYVKRGVPQHIRRPDNITVYRTVDNNGWVTSQTDGKGQTTYYDYDVMGRLIEIDYPGTHYADTDITYTGLGAGIVQTTTRGAMRTTTTHDGMSRPVLVKSESLSGGGLTSYVKTGYDGVGQATFQSFPSTSSTPTDGVTTSYDALGRPLTVAENVSPYADTQYAYLSSNRTQVTDPANYVSTSWASGYGAPDDGDVIKVVDAMGATTQMTRDIHGKITQLSQWGTQNGYTASVDRYFWYDSRERLCRHRAPEMGDEVFEYDSLDRLWLEASGQPAGSGCVTPPASDRTEYVYDALDRVTTVNYPGSTPDIYTVYDANSNATWVTRGGSEWRYFYDEIDQITQERLGIDGRSYRSEYTYTDEGYLKTIRMPRGRIYDYAPNGLGQPTQVLRTSTSREYAAPITYHPDGSLKSFTYRNGLVRTSVQNARGLVTELKVDYGGVPVSRLTYAHDANGRIVSQTDHVNAGESRTFGYDANGRLTSASGPWGSGSYKYDALGNIRDRDLGARTVDIAYNAAANRVSSVTDTANPYRAFTHDARGNVTNDGRYTFTYDHADQPVSMSGTGLSAAYVYDGNKRRVKQTVNGETVYSFYSRAGQLLFRDHASDPAKDVDYVYLAGEVITQIHDSAADGERYPHPDHLGSPLTQTLWGRTVQWRESYAPFGEKLLAAAANDDGRGYTGHIDDAATGLTYMQARYYDPLIGRFYSTDPVDYKADLNLYAYVYNDPVNITDPNGECPICVPAAIFAARAGYAGYRAYRGYRAATAAAKAAELTLKTSAAVAAGAVANEAIENATEGGAEEAADGGVHIGGTKPAASPPYDDVDGEVTQGGINEPVGDGTQTGRGEIATGADDDEKNDRAQEGTRTRETTENGLGAIHEMLEEVVQPDPTGDFN